MMMWPPYVNLLTHLLTYLLTIAALVCIVYLYITCTFRAMLQHVRSVSEPITREDLLETLADGDIVFFSCQEDGTDIVTKSSAVYCKTCFYHVGIVVSGEAQELNSIPRKFILHVVDPWTTAFYEPLRICPQDGSSLCVSSLETMLQKKYQDGTVFGILSPIESLESRDILEGALAIACWKPYTPYLVPNYVWHLMSPLMSLGGGPVGPAQNMHCNTFVGLLMERLGRLPPADQPDVAYIPGKLIKALSRALTMTPMTMYMLSTG